MTQTLNGGAGNVQAGEKEMFGWMLIGLGSGEGWSQLLRLVRAHVCVHTWQWTQPREVGGQP